MDTFKRFPTLAGLVKLVMQKQIAALINDTNKNEEMAIELVKQSVQKTPSLFHFIRPDSRSLALTHVSFEDGPHDLRPGMIS